MKLHRVGLILSAFFVLGTGLSLSGCANSPATSQPTQIRSSYLETQKGQRCRVLYRLNDTISSSANGILKDVDAQWIVVSNVTEPAFPANGKQTDITSEYCIATQAIIHVSFPKQ
jgi:hypothetical protein